MKKNKSLYIVLLLVLAMAVSSCSKAEKTGDEISSSGTVSDFVSEGKNETQDTEPSRDITENISQLYETPEEYIRYGIADSVDKVRDSVVSIEVTSIYPGAFLDYTVEESGSGVVISDDGYIATNYHVIENAKDVKVYLSDGEELFAEIIGKDPKTDIAVIKVKTDKKLPPVTFADCSTLRVGDFVFAIGNAMGEYPGTVTMGIVSALEREVIVNQETMKMIQTDAALNSGNSGGGLFDSHGYLVGIVAAKSAEDESECLGFAIPSHTVRNIVNDLVKYGYVKGRPTLGFETADITSMKEARLYGLEWIGVYISSVNEGGLAETAGLKSRDYIHSVNGEVITTTNRLDEILEGCSVGDTLLLEIWRGADSIDVILAIGEETP